MRAMILAAGRGERLKPLTDKTPKPLVEVNGHPLIVHHLHALRKAGCTEIVINVWYLAEQIIAALGDGSKYGVSIEYSVEQTLLNTGGGIVHALALLGREPFIVLSADILTDFPLHTLPTQPAGLAHLVLVNNPSYHTSGDFSLQHGLVGLTGAKLTYANIAVYRPEFFVNAPAGAFALGQLLKQHIVNKAVHGQYYTGMWHNIGTVEELELANIHYGHMG